MHKKLLWPKVSRQGQLPRLFLIKAHSFASNEGRELDDRGRDIRSYGARNFSKRKTISPPELMTPRSPLSGIVCVGTATAVRSQLNTPTVSRRAWEDISLEDGPTRNVDYLSHEWEEEDIWTSWRYVVAKNDFSNKVRLENASWRTWAKLKYRLTTVSPETLDWLVAPLSLPVGSSSTS